LLAGAFTRRVNEVVGATICMFVPFVIFVVPTEFFRINGIGLRGFSPEQKKMESHAKAAKAQRIRKRRIFQKMVRTPF
jgi:hypothetical protein